MARRYDDNDDDDDELPRRDLKHGRYVRDEDGKLWVRHVLAKKPTNITDDDDIREKYDPKEELLELLVDIDHTRERQDTNQTILSSLLRWYPGLKVQW